MSSDLARIGKAIGAPARAAMINLLFDGTAHTAGELARAAGVTSGTASQHLKVLTEAGIVAVRPHGRFRSYELADTTIAEALEQLSGPDLRPVTSLRLSREQRRVRAARTCYDHLAGQLGVALADRFVDGGWVDRTFATLTDGGVDALDAYFDIGPEQLFGIASRRPLLRACPDWTEQRDHVAGRLGALIADAALANRWVLRRRQTRGLTVTDAGRDALGRMGVVTPDPGRADTRQP